MRVTASFSKISFKNFKGVNKASKIAEIRRLLNRTIQEHWAHSCVAALNTLFAQTTTAMRFHAYSGFSFSAFAPFYADIWQQMESRGLNVQSLDMRKPLRMYPAVMALSSRKIKDNAFHPKSYPAPGKGGLATGKYKSFNQPYKVTQENAINQGVRYGKDMMQRKFLIFSFHEGSKPGRFYVEPTIKQHVLGIKGLAGRGGTISFGVLENAEWRLLEFFSKNFPMEHIKRILKTGYFSK